MPHDCPTIMRNIVEQAIHSKKLEKMAVEKENLVTSINECHTAIDAKVSEISNIANTALGMQEQMSDLEMDESLMQSRTSHALSLYSKVSNISWDYTAPPGVLAGCTYLLLSCLPMRKCSLSRLQTSGTTTPRKSVHFSLRWLAWILLRSRMVCGV